MKSTLLTLILFLAALLLLTFAFGCGDDDDDDNSSVDDDDDDDDATDDDTSDDDDDDDDNTTWPENDHIDKGKEYLEASAAGYAQMEFEMALDEVPGHPDALYGLILANSLYEWDTISLITTYLGTMLSDFEPPKSKDDPSMQNLLDELLDQVLGSLIFDRHNYLMESWEQWEQTAPEREFQLEKMPIWLTYELFAEPGGAYDETEGQAAAAMSLVLSGLLHHLTALNIDMPLSTVLGLMDFDFDAYTTEELIAIFVDMALDLLNEPAYPDFLTFGQEGLMEVKAAGTDVGLGFLAAHEAIQKMGTDIGTDEVLGRADLNGNGAVDIGDPYYVDGIGNLDEDQTAYLLAFDELFYSLAESFLDYTPYDLNPDEVTPFNISELKIVLNAFGIWLPIPNIDLLDIDLGGMYVDPEPDFIRNELKLILNVVAALLPAPPPY